MTAPGRLLTWSRLPRKEPDLDRDALRALAESRDRKTWRGKDLRKLTLPWTTREVVFTCANGWTIERIHEADRWLEGLCMGHCMGIGPDGKDAGLGYLHLIDAHGVPHV